MKIRYAQFLILACLSSFARAAAPQLDQGGGGGFFGSIVDFMQTWVDFIAGPWAILIAFIGLVAVLFLWILAPRAGEVIGLAIRVVIGAFVLFNVGAILSTLQA